MNRRDFIRLALGVTASAFAPNLLAHKKYDVVGGRGDLSDITYNIRIKDISEPKNGDADVKRILFSKMGYPDITKQCVVSGGMKAVSSDKNNTKEMAYQVARKMKEVMDDYLYMEYGDKYKEKMTPKLSANQLNLFIYDLKKLEKSA